MGEAGLVGEAVLFAGVPLDFAPGWDFAPESTSGAPVRSYCTEKTSSNPERSGADPAGASVPMEDVGCGV